VEVEKVRDSTGQTAEVKEEQKAIKSQRNSSREMPSFEGQGSQTF
jgi:hypothetical protein